MARTIITKHHSKAADARVQAAHDSVFDDYQFGLNKKPEPELTPWFDEDTPPVRIGVYQVKPFQDDDEIRYAYWSGILWSFWSSDISYLKRHCAIDIASKLTHDALSWRGLAEKPA